MSNNFDNIIDRSNTNSLKYDFAIERGKPQGILPLWVADMDFQVPEVILNDLKKTVEHGIFGYSEAKASYFNAVHDWFLKYFSWDTKPEWLVKTPGVVFAIAQAIRAFTKEGDAILIQQPVYYPFAECILDNNRKLVNNQLQFENGKYSINFKDFEEKIVSENVKLFILCSPHNPVGRVWTIEELKRLGELCLKHNVLVISDEIHCDFTYEGNTHTVFASISKEFEKNSIVCTSPSKTFNLAGLQASNIFIPNQDFRLAFQHAVDATGYSQLNTFALVGCQSAYEKGDAWLLDLKEYLKGNLDFVRAFLNERLPKIKLIEPQGTYLVWLDCSELGLTYKELEDLVVNKANLWLDSGRIFGKETSLFERINIACPRATLLKALEQLERAVNS